MTDLDFTARYRVTNWPGVAVRLERWPTVWVPFTYTDVDEDGDEIEVESNEGEFEDDTHSGRIVVVMVGDDKEHTVDVTDLTKLDELDYCLECGQIGCGHDGRER